MYNLNSRIKGYIISSLLIFMTFNIIGVVTIVLWTTDREQRMFWLWRLVLLYRKPQLPKPQRNLRPNWLRYLALGGGERPNEVHGIV